MAKKKNLTDRQKRIRRRRRKSTMSRVVFALEIIILVVLMGGLFVYAKLGNMNYEDLNFENVDVNQSVEENQVMKGYTSIALVGLDSREGELDGDVNSDTMIIASINNDTKKVKLVSIYRDTYLRVGSNSDGENVYNKANSAFCTGGPEKMMTMMNKNLDLNIVDYVTVDFKGVAEAVELLGGIDVHVIGVQVLVDPVDGFLILPLSQAVEGMYHRAVTAGVLTGKLVAARQREVIYKIVEKAKNSSISTLSKVLDKVFPLIKTSLTKPEILQMGMSMLSYDIEDQTGFPFDHLYGGVVEDAMDGLDCVLPITLESNVIKLHEFLYPEDSYVPSDEVKTYSQKIIEISGFGEESRLDHSEDGSLAAYHESDTESANPAENSADSQEESQTDVTDDTQGYDDSSLEQ